MDGRAFGKLEEAFFRSGAVISVGSCKIDSKGPSRPPQIASSGPVLVGAPLNECVQLGLKNAVELGSYYSAFVLRIVRQLEPLWDVELP